MIGIMELHAIKHREEAAKLIRIPPIGLDLPPLCRRPWFWLGLLSLLLCTPGPLLIDHALDLLSFRSLRGGLRGLSRLHRLRLLRRDSWSVRAGKDLLCEIPAGRALFRRRVRHTPRRGCRILVLFVQLGHTGGRLAIVLSVLIVVIERHVVLVTLPIPLVAHDVAAGDVEHRLVMPLDGVANVRAAPRRCQVSADDAVHGCPLDPCGNLRVEALANRVHTLRLLLRFRRIAHKLFLLLVALL